MLVSQDSIYRCSCYISTGEGGKGGHSTGVGRWFELGGDNNDPNKIKYFSLHFTPDLLSKLLVEPKI